MKERNFSTKYDIFLPFLFLLISFFAYAQLSQEDIHQLKQEAAINGWTFEVGETSATQRSLKELTGYIPPDPQYLDELIENADKPVIPTEKLPSRWDWREKTPGGLPPIRDQGSCGSCWAFATVGALECAIKIKDGIIVDLSEQWLVDCARGLFWYGCDGGISAHDWHKGSKKDSCGGYGAVLETDYPYVGYQSSCGCPKPHYYTINDWHYVGPMLGIPSLDALKTAIYRYGPIVSAMEAKESFLAYKGGVYNDNMDSKATPNHMVVIVGWDDNYDGGAFIIRNSWGPYWGENGYGYIAYGSSQIGYGADYIEYGTPTDLLLVTPQQNLLFYLSSNNFISPSSIGINLENISEYNINWTSTVDEGIALAPSSGTLSPGEIKPIQLTVIQRPVQSGAYTKNFSITNTSTQVTQNFSAQLKRTFPAPITFTLNTDPGWEKTGNWAFGKPSGLGGDPSSGYTGQYVYGYNLNGTYENDMGEEILTSCPIDCSNLQNVSLSFYCWLGVESSSYDHARVDVSTNGTTWTNVWNHTGETVQDMSWSLKTYNISSIADRQPLLLIRWVMGPTDYSYTYSGWNIDDISISGNPINVIVPNVVNQPLPEAINTITSAGLTQGQTSSACSNSIPEGSVISQVPKAGSLVPAGSQVNLTVSSGYCPVTVPNVLGWNHTEAEIQITSVGLTIGNIEYSCEETVPENAVICQAPLAGTEVTYGSPVNLVISTGPCPPEGSTEGEGTSEGTPEGTLEGEGMIEGTHEGIPEGAVEGIQEGDIEGETTPTHHSADKDNNGVIDLSELLRVIQFFNFGAYHCQSSSEDGYAPGEGTDYNCTPHASDYKPQDWKIDLSELLRLIQFFNFGGYSPCPGIGEDNFCPGNANI